jgi:glutaredoxin 3
MSWWSRNYAEEPKKIDWESEEMKAVAERVQQLISQNPVMIFGKYLCPYCREVKTVFKRRGTPYVELKIEDESQKQGEAIKDYLEMLTGRRHLPHVFIHGRHIGGCKDLLRLEGEPLDLLLKKA